MEGSGSWGAGCLPPSSSPQIRMRPDHGTPWKVPRWRGLWPGEGEEGCSATPGETQVLRFKCWGDDVSAVCTWRAEVMGSGPWGVGTGSMQMGSECPPHGITWGLVSKHPILDQ